jgi:hypothetical protein
VISAIAASTLLAAGLGFAQVPPGFGPPPPPDRPHDCEDAAARTAGMLAFAEVKLAITDAERAGWTDFTGKVKSAEEPVAAACRLMAGKAPPASLPERLARLDDLESARVEALHRTRLAVDQIYAQLSPAQQRVADRLWPEPPPGPGHEPPGHGGPPPGGPGDRFPPPR